jgi:hypothetical protein
MQKSPNMGNEISPISPFERRVACPSGTVVDAYYGDGATLIEVQVTHPLAMVTVVEDSRVSGQASRT